MSDDKTIDITPKTDAAIVKRGYTPSSLDEYARVGKLAMTSRLCSVTSIEDATVMLLTGAELGLGPMQSLRGIHVVKGKPVLSADMLAAVCLASPECVYMYPKEMTAEQCTYTTLRRGMPEPCVMTYTMEDAKRAGLTGNPTWKKHPQAMLKARCVAQMARAIYPDLTLGVYVEDEGEEIAGKHEAPAPVEARVVPDGKDHIEETEALMREWGVTEEAIPEVVSRCLYLAESAGKTRDEAAHALYRRVRGEGKEGIHEWVGEMLDREMV